ncbi:hypothetical protein [Actinoplanes siamensis]|uniref:Uncharacterized protein n=1 Tax=Actinoplanes siamensis TaxID=1223317 RepID=A0A919N9G5_9ACTN|nr:hypothetical protein [Actinoplanes siamensis]GIF06994.1 hypothetical protein Asi03nite_45320 [Actinoplanes siamensis]
MASHAGRGQALDEGGGAVGEEDRDLVIVAEVAFEAFIYAASWQAGADRVVTAPRA